MNTRIKRNEREEIKAALGLTGLSYEPDLAEAIRGQLSVRDQQRISLEREGVYRVKHPERETPFMLSIMPDKTGAIFGAAGYEIGQKRPIRGKHMLLKPHVRQWISMLSLDEY